MVRDSLKERVRRYWDDNVDRWKIARSESGSPAFFEEIERYRFEKLEYLPRIVDFGGYAGLMLLDVGCGLGNDLSRFVRGGALGTGIDISSRAIRLARRNFDQRGLEARFVEMDGENLAFDDCSFDVVYCHTVIHFTPDPGALIEEIFRVLKPGGHAILMTVNRRSWLYLLHRLARVRMDYMDAPVFRQYSAGEFRGLLSPFPRVELITERFPVKTKVHRGIKAKLYNLMFVDLFNALPRFLTRNIGYHLVAFAYKDRVPADRR